MSSYRDNIEFVKRTKQLVKSYQGDYEASLLINMSIGLLFVAKEKYGFALGRIKNTDVLNQWGIDPGCIKCCKHFNRKKNKVEDEPKTLNSICRHIRNSLAHCNFEVVNDNERRIIVAYRLFDWCFIDRDNNNPVKTFEYEISVESLKRFLNAVSDYIIKNHKSNNTKY